MNRELIVLLSDRPVGRVIQDRRGRLSFAYDEAWRETRGAYPLSLSMPLAAIEHPHTAIDAFIWGLLPDNELILGSWAKKFQVSARNPFSLISHVGEDCAGAVQFVLPDRMDAVLGATEGDIEWLDEAQIAARLRKLREDQSAWRQQGDTGQFSLAGAQPKTALLLKDKRWGVPSGRIPTTHILKPPTAQFDGHAENEHFCLSLARKLGLPAASSSVIRFGEEVAVVVERYDRQHTTQGIRRVHQEDMCQAMGVPPTQKYENEGGPGVARIVNLLRDNSGSSAEDVGTFIEAIAFNWLIGGTDAHAKNYSILFGGGSVRLAPLYDVASILPYDDIDPMRATLAMKLGGEYRIRDTSVRSWIKLAQEIGSPGEKVVETVRSLANRLPDAIGAVHADMHVAGMTHMMVDRLAERLTMRAARCEAMLTPG